MSNIKDSYDTIKNQHQEEFLQFMKDNPDIDIISTGIKATNGALKFWLDFTTDSAITIIKSIF